MSQEPLDLDDMDDAFTGKTAKPAPAEDDDEYEYPNFQTWVEQWLVHAVTLKLSDGGKGRVWCAQWWRHLPVCARLEALWRAWEKARRASDDHAMIAWYVYDCDPTMRALTDGESGPMHACSPTHHRDVPSLPTTPVPDGHFATVAAGSAAAHDFPLKVRAEGD